MITPTAREEDPDNLLGRCPGNGDGGVVVVRFQRRPYPDLKNCPPAWRELVIDVALSLVALKAKHIWSEQSFADVITHTIKTWKHQLSSYEFSQASALLPRSYRAALTLLSQEESCVWNNQIHYQMCVHCRLVFRCEHKDLTVCLCGHPRSLKNICKLVYMPVSGHMVSTYGVADVAKCMGSWHDRRTKDPNKVKDSTDVINSFNFDPTKEMKGDNDQRHWMLTHINDPFAPFKDDMFYSCSPGLVHVLNLPAWVRQKLGYAHLLSIGPGSRRRDVAKELANKQVKTDRHQHAIFADELNYLDKFGIQIFDAYTQKPFRCKARLVNCVSDLRGMEKLIGISSTPARYGCLHCWWEGFRVGGKQLYCGHQTMLAKDDPLRLYLQHRNAPTVTKADRENEDKADYNRKTAQHPIDRDPCAKRCHFELVTCWKAPTTLKPLVDGEDSVVQLGEWFITHRNLLLQRRCKL